jgi:RNA polymerase sigma factor (sigma-70 family)
VRIRCPVRPPIPPSGRCDSGIRPAHGRYPAGPGAVGTRGAAKGEPSGARRCTKDVSTTREGNRIADGGRAPDERAVIARVRSGDPGAYAELVRAHTPIALRAARALGAGADAEDVVQQAFLKAYYSLERFDAGRAFRPWLLRIVTNETNNTVRGAARRRLVPDGEAALSTAAPPVPESADPAAAALSSERNRALHAAVQRLSDPHRLVVTYRYLLEMDEAETAEALGWPRGTVKSRLARALRRLGRLLPPELSGDERPGAGRRTDRRTGRPADRRTDQTDGPAEQARP